MSDDNISTLSGRIFVILYLYYYLSESRNNHGSIWKKRLALRWMECHEIIKLSQIYPRLFFHWLINTIVTMPENCFNPYLIQTEPTLVFSNTEGYIPLALFCCFRNEFLWSKDFCKHFEMHVSNETDKRNYKIINEHKKTIRTDELLTQCCDPWLRGSSNRQ